MDESACFDDSRVRIIDSYNFIMIIMFAKRTVSDVHIFHLGEIQSIRIFEDRVVNLCEDLSSREEESCFTFSIPSIVRLLLGVFSTLMLVM